MASSHQEVLVQCRQHDVKAVALHVTDILGVWHRMTIPVSRLTEESFEDGFAWELQNLGGQRGHMSDVLLIPQPSTAFIEPFSDPPTLGMICTMHDPMTREEWPEDPRTIAMNAEKYVREAGVADELHFALTVEFFLFDSQSTRPSSKGQAASPSEFSEADLPSPRTHEFGEAIDNFCSALMLALIECGVDVIAHRQSSSDPFKSFLSVRASGLVSSADQLMITKHIVKRMAETVGKSATFMPLPQIGREPAGMTTQLSMLKSENCMLSGAGYAGLSDAGVHAIGGVLRHCGALVALTNSTTNSYSRLNACPASLPKVAYSQSDLTAALRVPSSHPSKNKCLEFRPPDSASNPYLAFTGLVMAAADGMQNKIHPGEPLEFDPYHTEAAKAEASKTNDGATTGPRVPVSLEAALLALENDGEFLFRGDVFPPEVLESWIAHKRLYDVQYQRGPGT